MAAGTGASESAGEETVGTTKRPSSRRAASARRSTARAAAVEKGAAGKNGANGKNGRTEPATLDGLAGIKRMRQPRLAEMVANELRERIVSGQLADGNVLPGLDQLVKEFGVSYPSLREALRILENEGLITVRRGKLGGSEVHRPKPEGAAYMLGLVLAAERVPVSDLVAALGQLEPLCARMCAGRADRRRTVVTKLRQIQRETTAAIDDVVAFEDACQRFHRQIVEGCGNRTLRLAVSAFERLWHEQQEGWSHKVAVLHEYPDIALRQAGIDAHAALLDAIDVGDEQLAERLAYRHLQNPAIRDPRGGRAIVQVGRPWGDAGGRAVTSPRA